MFCPYCIVVPVRETRAQDDSAPKFSLSSQRLSTWLTPKQIPGKIFRAGKFYKLAAQ
jgi:hypothetical protein